ncbi:MAG: hypothetical protein WAX69_06835 [Victivallales bacterium]
MRETPKTMPVSIYFVWQWWEKHCLGAAERPATIDMDWMDKAYIARQRFLHEHFAEFGIGAGQPVVDKAFLSKVMPFHTMIIPVALGMDIEIQEYGGYAWQNMTEDQLKKLKPVDIANTAAGEVILKQRQERLDRYGMATQMIDLASVTNNAFMMRGPEFYADLIVEKDFARHYMGAIRETMCMAYRSISGLFGPIDGFPLGNCNVTMMSPDLYDEMICQYDMDCVKYAAELTGKKPNCQLHHCNVKTEPFAETYGRIPGLTSLQGSYQSDIRKIHEVLPGIDFSAMVNPVELLSRPLADVFQDLEISIASGAANLAIWDIDSTFSPEKMKELFDGIRNVADKCGRKAVFSVIPIGWEELAWEFPQYVKR